MDLVANADDDAFPSMEEGAERLASGLVMKTLKSGNATHYPRPPATCRVHYEARLPDGELFDSSRARAQPLLFRLGAGQLIPGLEEGLQRMSVGQLCRFTVPPALAYGQAGYAPIVPPNATLTYDLELLAFSQEDDLGSRSGEHAST